MADSLRDYLAATEAAGPLLAHAALLRKLAAVYRRVVPGHLAESSRVANYRAQSRTLVVLAETGAVAAKLRQMAPSVATELARHGYDCTTVHVRVQARPAVFAVVGRPPCGRPLSPSACDRLRALSESLPPSPLREALERLLQRAIRQE